MSRKVILVIFVFVLLGLVGGAYFYFKKPPTTTLATQPANQFGQPSNSSSGTTSASNLGSTQVVDTPSFVPGSGQPLPRLYELNGVPVAGVTFVESGSGKKYTASARYIERGTGNIFDTDLSTYVESRIVNETRSRVSEALWGQGGKSVVVRSLVGSVIKTSILNLSNPTKLLAPDGTKNFMKTEEISLPDSISFMATAEDGTNKLFYLLNSSSSATGSVSSFKNTLTSKIFSTPFTDWLPQFPNQNLVTLTTKPSVNTPGYLFFLDTTTKALTKVLGDINGLTTLTSPDGSLTLYSETKDGVPELYVYNVATKSIRNLSTKTLPEKCVWSRKETTVVYCAVPKTIPTGAYPDEWYQGVVSFNDSIWKIDTKNTDAQELTSATDLNGAQLDMINLSLTSNDSNILFIDKGTGTPWLYKI